MHFDYIIYGEGISAEIAALSLAQNNFKVCFIKNGAHNKNESNLFTFLAGVVPSTIIGISIQALIIMSTER